MTLVLPSVQLAASIAAVSEVRRIASVVIDTESFLKRGRSGLNEASAVGQPLGVYAEAPKKLPLDE
ncbi:hypothetical protein ACLOJK_017724 [Asimina triloba]